MMSFSEIADLIESKFGPAVIIDKETEGLMPFLVIKAEQLVEVMQFLHTDEKCYFDLLNCVTGLDNGVESNLLEVAYNLTSIPLSHKLTIKVNVSRSITAGVLPKLPSMSHIWRTADWHEREVFDLFGIEFIGHHDLRRILLPATWEGYPLRKDYEVQEYYHGVKVKY